MIFEYEPRIKYELMDCRLRQVFTLFPYKLDKKIYFWETLYILEQYKRTRYITCNNNYWEKILVSVDRQEVLDFVNKPENGYYKIRVRNYEQFKKENND